jgi:hypothetical protein
MTFPFFGVLDNTKDFRKKALERAAEGHISLFKCFANMLRHAIRGDNLANIDFYQDGYGDIYDMQAIRNKCEQSEAEDAAGELKTFESADEGLAYLYEMRKAVQTKGHIAEV